MTKLNFVNAVKGFLIGIALLIPGLSGSIFAIVLGVYEDCLDAVANFRKAPIRYIKFLLPLAIGGGIGIIASAGLILFITARFPVMSYMFFAGLVIGSWPLVTKKMGKDGFKIIHIMGAIGAIIIMVLLARLSEHTGSQAGEHIAILRITSAFEFGTMFLVGLISVSLMVIPGISGSIMVIVLGHYGTVYNAISETAQLLRHTITFNTEMWLASFQTVFVLVPFSIGAILGVIYISKILLFCLKKAEKFVYSCVCGALIGTVYILLDMGVFPYYPAGEGLFSAFIFGVVALGSLIVGIVCTLYFEKGKK